MKKVLALVLCILLFQNYLQAETEPTLHFCTVASDRKLGLVQLLRSCLVYNIPMDVLGLGMPFRGLNEKLIHIKRYVEDIPETDIVMFVDAYDVLFLSTPEQILKKFKKMNSNFVIAVERTCWPYGELASKFPQSPTSLRYLNSGAFIGYAGHIKQILKEVSPIVASGDDQGELTKHYFKKQKMYTFDYKGELFLTMMGLGNHEVIIDTRNRTVTFTETYIKPCIVHGNGTSRPLYQLIFDAFFKIKI